ncbi:MAG: SRPBCC family protein [Bacteroidota bacterium]
MRKGIQTVHELKAPIQAVWDRIKTGANWEDWLPILAGSAVTGNHRTCNVPGPDGTEDVFEELFLAMDLEKTFIYQIHKQQSFPASDIIGFIRLNENGASTTMHWSVEMTVESEEIFQGLKGQIEMIYGDATNKLEELANVTA